MPDKTSYVASRISEASILRSRADRFEKLPDAMITTESGPHVIEFGGSYPAEKLERFHDYCDENRFSYELW